ncbi:MAG: hypothetical protein KatS3mg057_2574 [Herpetosiphonaceae bacterium]|nr:MAG: hypothetical protein KatS3mg057_2574 [Herpetosiphonaceae bacterium]
MPIFLDAHTEKLAPAHDRFKRSDGKPLLYHQLRTPLALQAYDLVVNTYNTGTGKTIAALMYLLDPAMSRNTSNVLVIAPTNAILRQHADDIEEFVQAHGLRHIVQPVTAEQLSKLKPGYGLRRGELLYRLMTNPREFMGELRKETADLSRRPLIMVVNPDIFHYALFYQYNSADRKNVFQALQSAFQYIVIDEFHYYDSKQLVSFLLFFILSQEWGYFHEGRKICLLSATPTEQLQQFLTRIFGERWTMIAPENEPPESAAYERVPALAPVELEIVQQSLEEWVAQHVEDVAAWSRQGLDIALISSSLAQINRVYDRLIARGLSTGRITGPVPEEKRQQAVQQPIILATPTVDLGYNFARQGKDRQPIDIVVFDARFQDEAIQRLGRAGRVLGRSIVDQQSRAVALLPEEAALALRAYEGQRLSRPEFNALLRSLQQLPPKHNLFRYISTYGVVEVFYPLALHSERELPEEQNAELERLYEAVRAVFAPQSRPRQTALRYEFAIFRKRERFIKERRANPRWLPEDGELRSELKRMARWWATSGQVVEETRLDEFVAQIKRFPDRGPGKVLESFIAEQYHLTQALFSFRESFAVPGVPVSDPKHLLSTEDTASYDFFHLLEHYQYELLDAEEYAARTGRPRSGARSQTREQEIYLLLRDRRSPPDRVSLILDYNGSHEQFQQVYARRPVARSGFEIQIQQGHELPKPLPKKLAQAIKTTYFPFLAVPEHEAGPLICFLRRTPFFNRKLRVVCNGTEYQYQAVFGAGAFHIYAEIGWQLRKGVARDAELSDPIIL